MVDGTWATREQQARLENKMRMLRWRSENYGKMTEVVRPCEQNERAWANSEKNARCGHTREKKERAVKSEVERCVQEYYRGLKEENSTNRAAWRKKINSYTSYPR